VPNQHFCLQRTDLDLARHACRDLARRVHTTRLYASFQRLALHTSKETSLFRDQQKRPTKESYKTALHASKEFGAASLHMSKETIKRDHQKRPSKETIKRDHQKRDWRSLCNARVFKSSHPVHTSKETNKRDLQTSKVANKRDKQKSPKYIKRAACA